MFEKMTFQTDFNIGNVILSLSTDTSLLADTRSRTVQTSPVSSSVVQEEQTTFDSQVVDECLKWKQKSQAKQNKYSAFKNKKCTFYQ